MLEIQPTAEGHVRMAQLQLQLRDLPGMQESLSLAAALDPREGGVFMVTGDALAMQGRFAEARLAWVIGTVLLGLGLAWTGKDRGGPAS